MNKLTKTLFHNLFLSKNNHFNNINGYHNLKYSEKFLLNNIKGHFEYKKSTISNNIIFNKTSMISGITLKDEDKGIIYVELYNIDSTLDNFHNFKVNEKHKLVKFYFDPTYNYKKKINYNDIPKEIINEFDNYKKTWCNCCGFRD